MMRTGDGEGGSDGGNDGKQCSKDADCEGNQKCNDVAPRDDAGLGERLTWNGVKVPVAGVYRMCYAHDAKATFIDVGKLTVAGPFGPTKQALSDQPPKTSFRLVVQGVFPYVFPHVPGVFPLVLLTTQKACLDTQTTVASKKVSLSVPTASTAGDELMLNEVVINEAGNYLVCYAHPAAALGTVPWRASLVEGVALDRAAVEEASLWTVPLWPARVAGAVEGELRELLKVGELTVAGPDLDQAFSAVADKAIDLVVPGFELKTTTRIVAIEGKDCSGASKSSSAITGLDGLAGSLEKGGASAQSTTLTWKGVKASISGVYSLCMDIMGKGLFDSEAAAVGRRGITRFGTLRVSSAELRSVKISPAVVSAGDSPKLQISFATERPVVPPLVRRTLWCVASRRLVSCRREAHTRTRRRRGQRLRPSHLSQAQACPPCPDASFPFVHVTLLHAGRS